MTTANPLHRLTDLGQSVWLDYIERGFIQSGELARVIRDDRISGLTSNPAIFHKALVGGGYDEVVKALAREGRSPEAIWSVLVVEDIRSAADALAGVYANTRGRDGYVSLEVSPLLARHAQRTIADARRLASLVQRPNLMLKVPGTTEGVDAISRLTAEGFNINVTLLFSPDRYDAIADAYMQGLEQRVAAGEPIERIASVASFFVSRIDTLVDERLASRREASALRGLAAIALAKLAYDHYRSLRSSARWRALESRGARLQRVLWASTGTKNPAYSDVKYVDALIAPGTIATLPVETLIAYRDHGDPAVRLNGVVDGGGPDPEYVLQRLAQVGIDAASVAAQLEEEGVRKFVEPFEATLAVLRERVRKLQGQPDA
ncbi:MAG TPA: transaldolase [Steroidobacter sp.]|nr:transaldolase [Steroidobacter sp.]